MTDEMLHVLTWIAIAAGGLTLVGLLEVLFRGLATRFGTPQTGCKYRHDG